jgi:hypothetical protein
MHSAGIHPTKLKAAQPVHSNPILVLHQVKAPDEGTPTASGAMIPIYVQRHSCHLTSNHPSHRQILPPLAKRLSGGQLPNKPHRSSRLTLVSRQALGCTSCHPREPCQRRVRRRVRRRQRRRPRSRRHHMQNGVQPDNTAHVRRHVGEIALTEETLERSPRRPRRARHVACLGR